MEKKYSTATIKINTSKDDSLCSIAVYIPPGNDALGESFIEKLTKQLNSTEEAGGETMSSKLLKAVIDSLILANEL